MKKGEKSNNKDILSTTIKIAVQIYKHQQLRDEPSTIPQLYKDFNGEIDKESISKALDTLLDLGICKISTQFQKTQDQQHLIKSYVIDG